MRLKHCIIINFALWGIIIGIINYNCSKTYVATVNTVDVKYNSFWSEKGKAGTSTYMVYTELEDGGVRVFRDEDVLMRLKFNSSDIYAQLHAGKKYKFRVIGWRIPLLSKYENIISVDEIKE